MQNFLFSFIEKNIFLFNLFHSYINENTYSSISELRYVVKHKYQTKMLFYFLAMNFFYASFSIKIENLSECIYCIPARKDNFLKIN